MIIPVVTGDINAGAVEELIALCVRYHRLRTGPGPAPDAPRDSEGSDGGGSGGNGASRSSGVGGSPDSEGSGAVPAGLIGSAARQAGQAAAVAAALAELEHQIVGKVLQVVSGPGGVASFLRRQLLGKDLNGPSLPLDVGQSDDISVHLRRLVALRDQGCQHPGGCSL